MVLWIRSQDRTILLPINNKLYIPNSKTGEDFGIFYEETMLGHYKKRERALEVLDEIHDELIGSNFMPMNEEEVLTCGSAKIYEMPEE